MVRSSMRDEAYDIILADIRLPDMSGHQLMMQLKELVDPVPLILMTGFGYDPGHSIVKARQAGLHPKAILYKPFRLDQLLAGVEAVLEATQAVTQQT
jgi:DNA-binding response OmpR family regulator